MSFESDMRRLAGIIEELGRDDVALDRALQLFEEGVERLRTASAELSRAETQVKQLVERPSGELEVTDFRG